MITTSFLEYYFRDGLLDKALRCVEELESPPMVKLSILPMVAEPVFNLVQHLLKKKVLGSKDVIEGCVRCAATMLEDLDSDSPVALPGFGSLIGMLVSAGVLDFKVVKWILVEFDNQYNRCVVFGSVLDGCKRDDQVMKSQSRDVAACRKLCDCE